MTNMIRDHIEIVVGASRPKARIAGQRIRVQDVVVWHEKLGMFPDEIIHHYPTLTLADIHAALAYYWDHRDEIERAIQTEHNLAEEIRQSNVSPLGEKIGRQPHRSNPLSA
jgi:uncharacterized protein (DUF433 family)